jgi:hypothetical protein
MRIRIGKNVVLAVTMLCAGAIAIVYDGVAIEGFFTLAGLLVGHILTDYKNGGKNDMEI